MHDAMRVHRRTMVPVLLLCVTDPLSEPMPSRQFLSESRVMVIDNQGRLIRDFGLPFKDTVHFAAMSFNGAWCTFHKRSGTYRAGMVTVAVISGPIIEHKDVG
jgi:hypothetical protein